MNSKNFKICGLLVFCFFMLSQSSQAGVPKKRVQDIAAKQKSDNQQNLNNDVISSEVGLKIPDWGIAVDAVFNPELTDVIPGYHILNIVLSNHRNDTIMLNRKSDKWVIIDRLGKKHTALNHVKDFDEKLWAVLPEELKQLIDYPTMVSPGKSITIDVFVPKDIELTNFKEVRWRSEYFAKEFNLFTNYEQKISVGTENANEFSIPTNSVSAETLEMQIKKTDQQEEFIKSKYSNNPNIGDITNNQNNNQPPKFDPSLDDTIIMN